MSLATVEYNDSIIYETDEAESFILETKDLLMEDDVKVTVNSGGNYDNFLIATGNMSGSIYDTQCSRVMNEAFYTITTQNPYLLGIEMPNVTEIGVEAFRNCTNLSVATFPNCTTIGNHAFDSCLSLSEVSFPNCTAIGESVFRECSSLLKASFPKMSIITGYAFNYAYFSELYLPNAEAISGYFAFCDCQNLTSLYAPKLSVFSSAAFLRCYKLSDLTGLPCSEITYVRERSFEDCIALMSVDFPNCTTIGMSAFLGCSSLSEISFPNCTTIGSSAFRGCSSLSEVSFPNCTTIHERAFSVCTALESVYLLNSVVATLRTSNTFQSTPITNSTYLGYYGSIYVPSSLVDAYKSASVWSQFSDRITSYIE